MAPTVKPAATKPASAGTKDKKLPAVPESKLKDGKRRLTSRVKQTLRKRVLRSKVLLRRRQNLIRAEHYTKKYLQLKKKVVEDARAAKKAGNIYIPERPRVAFVVRIRG
jgi:large subunit ribosomal protein L7e